MAQLSVPIVTRSLKKIEALLLGLKENIIQVCKSAFL
jgi:hypothetical protein